jgi:hypothetical protein
MPAKKGSKWDSTLRKYVAPLEVAVAKQVRLPGSGFTGGPPPPEPPKPVELAAPAPSSSPPPPPQDEESEFVTAADVKKAKVSPDLTISGTPGSPGFIAEIIEGLLMKVDEIELAQTGDPIFQRTPSDEKIEKGIAKYVESAIDPSKHGVVVLLGAYIGSHGLKWGIHGTTVAKNKADAMRKVKEKPNA